MQYMLMCCFDEKRWEEIPEAQRDGIMREYGEFVQSLVNSGHYLAGPAITDGPFAETKEQFGGYHLVECKDLDEAISIAKRMPTIPFGGTIEVRPLERMSAV